MRKLLQIVILSLALLGALPVLGQQGLPRGKWWKRPDVVRQLSISGDQQTRLDQIFTRHANVLIDAKAELEKSTLALRSVLDQTELDRKEIQSAAARVNQARSRIFEQELMMLVDMRGILTLEQWNRVRSGMESRRENQQQLRRGRPGTRKNP